MKLNNNILKIVKITAIFTMLFIFNFKNDAKVLAATYTWNQSDWVGGLSGGTFPDHTNFQTNWTKYFSKDSGITTNADGTLSIAPTAGSVSQTSSADFSVGTTSSVSILSDSIELSVGVTNSTLVQVVTGSSHSCALKNSGTVYCWGVNGVGQLGLNNTNNPKTTPQQVVGVGGSGYLTDVTMITAGEAFNCALKSDGSVYCWGYNNNGQLGIGNSNNQTTPQQVLGVGGSGFLTGVSAISAGQYHTCAVKTDGSAYCWGINSNGQLGLNNTDSPKTSPQQVLGVNGSGTLTAVRTIEAGVNHTCAVKTDGSAYCWGWNGTGQLGLNDTTQRTTPQQLLGQNGDGTMTIVSSITAGSNHTCAVKTSGLMYCWGGNNNGQLGLNNTTTPKTTPQQVLGVDGSGNIGQVSAITAGQYHTCAVKTDGTAYCWGINTSGQLGLNNTTSPKTTPQQVLGVGGSGTLATISGIAGGDTHSCAVKTNGTVYCWGLNASGQLGLNDTTQRLAPQQVLGVNGSGLLNLLSYYPAGNFVSSAIDLGQNSNLTYLSFGSTKPANTELKFQIRSATTANGLSEATWYGPTGTDDYYTDVGTTLNTTNNGDRFVQYKAFLETTDGGVTPSLSDITLNYEHYSADVASVTQTSDADFSVGTTSSVVINGDSVNLDTGGSLPATDKSLLHMNGNDATTTFTDMASKIWTAYGNAQLDTAQKKFGTASGLFDGTGDWIDTPDHADFDNSGGDNFTWECWYRLDKTASGGNIIPIFMQRNNDGVVGSPYSYVGFNASTQLAFSLSRSGGSVSAASSAADSVDNTFHHLALVRNGNALTLYKDGVSVASADLTGLTLINLGGTFRIGQDSTYPNEQIYKGWIDEVRISKGIAHWTNNFTPPTSAYSPYVNSGDFISGAFDVGNTNLNLTTLSWGSSTPTNTLVKFQMRSADTEGGLGGATWYGPTGTEDYYTNSSTAINSNNDGDRYVQYKAFLETTDTTATPVLSDITLGYIPLTNSVSLISSAYNTETNANLLSQIGWGETTPTNTEVKYQLRTAASSESIGSAEWTGPTGADSYFTLNTGQTSPSGLRDGVNDQWIQYKAFLETSDSGLSPTISDVTLTYVVNGPPEFDTSFGTNGVGITITSSEAITINYKVRDLDTNQGTEINRLKLWPTFEYSINNGDNWFDIGTTSVAGFTTESSINLNAGDTTAYVVESLVWNAKADIGSSYSTTTKVRVKVDDHEAANNETTATSDGFTLDGINPNGSITINDNNAKTNSQSVSLSFTATDDSSLEMIISQNSNFSGAEYGAYSDTSLFNLSAGDASKTVYVKFRDVFGNESISYSDSITLDTTAPTTPVGFLVEDISNTTNSEWKAFVNWSKAVVADWVNYKVYRKVSGGEYAVVSTITDINTNYFLDTGVSQSVTYYYKVTSSDNIENESSATSELSQLIEGEGDVTGPIISGVGTTLNATTTIGIKWTTEETADSVVLYSTDESFDKSQGAVGYVTSHLVTLGGLSAGTTYNYRVKSTDAFGNSTTSSSGSFTTASADTTGPVISSIGTTSVSQSGITITWTTNEASDSFIEYSTDSGFSNGIIFGQNNSVTNHSVILTSLNVGTSYFYKVRSTDAGGNLTASDENGFTTSADTSDVTGPVVSSITAGSLVYNGATITWTSNENSTSYVEYGTTESYGKVYGSNSSVTSHSVILPRDLTASTTYHYRVRSTDSAGNETISGNNTFITSVNPADSTGPTITSISVGTPTTTGVTLTWTTNESADSIVEFGTDLNYTGSQGVSTLATSHSVSLVNLTPSTTYYARVKSTDGSGNSTTNNNSSQGYAFTTADGAAAPVISAVASSVGSSAATITWTTDIDSDSYVEHGTTSNYGYVSGIGDSVTSHSVEVKGLIASTTYYYRVKSKEPTGSETVGVGMTFVTSSVESSNPTENSIIESVKTGTKAFVSKILNALKQNTDSIVESDLVSAINEIGPKIVSSPAIATNNIVVNPGIDKITISWTTDKKASSIVAYSFDKDFNVSADEPYTITVGNPDEEVLAHSVDLVNLNPNSTYHYQVRSKAKLGNWTKSSDYTFTTLAFNSEIKDLKFKEIEEKSITVAWGTTAEARAMIEIEDANNGKIVLKEEEKKFDTSHEFKTNNLMTSSGYKLKITSVAKDGTVSPVSIFPFSTAISNQPPEISNVRVSNALIPGTDQVQTIISWKTNKPSSSRIIYGEAAGKEMKMTTPLDKSLSLDHIVITTALKTGKIYKFKAESGDLQDNVSLSKDFIIMTPRPQESVINIIIDNFTQTFSFAKKAKK